MKLLEFKFFHLVVGLTLSVVFGVDAFAVTNLKKVQITDGSQIDLFFDSKINPAQIKTEFFNDIIQLSLTDVSVYPAKITSVSGMDLTKVFAYQYAPKLVRCRLSVKGKAEDFQNRFTVKAGGKVLSLRISGGAPLSKSSDKISQVAAQAETPKTSDPQEKALLERVLKADLAEEKKEAAKEAKDSKDSKEDRAPLTGEGLREGRNKSLAGAKPLPSPFKSLGVLITVLGLFGMGILAVKKFKGTPNIQKHKGLAGLLGKLGSSMGAKGRMIEVVATHYLGPKKSIAMVRIQGRMLVLGCTQESINLITEFKEGESMDDFNVADDFIQSLGAQPSVQKAQASPNPYPHAKIPVDSNGRLATSPREDLGPTLGQGAARGNAGASAAYRSAAAQNSEQPVRRPSQQSAGFAELLQAETARSSAQNGPSQYAGQPGPTRAQQSIREQIKNRMEGMKQL